MPSSIIQGGFTARQRAWGSGERGALIMHFLLVCSWKRFRGFVGKEKFGEEPWTRQGRWGQGGWVWVFLASTAKVLGGMGVVPW